MDNYIPHCGLTNNFLQLVYIELEPFSKLFLIDKKPNLWLYKLGLLLMSNQLENLWSKITQTQGFRNFITFGKTNFLPQVLPRFWFLSWIHKFTFHFKQAFVILINTFITVLFLQNYHTNVDADLNYVNDINAFKI